MRASACLGRPALEGAKKARRSVEERGRWARRTTRSRMPRIISASTLMSEAWPRMPPIEGWWIITRECGKASRLPLEPPASRREPMDAARPTLIVETSALT